MSAEQVTPLPWFVAGVRFRMNGSEWHSINRYDEYKQQDENIACVGYDPRTGLGLADAHFIVTACNNYPAMKAALEELAAHQTTGEMSHADYDNFAGEQEYDALVKEARTALGLGER